MHSTYREHRGLLADRRRVAALWSIETRDSGRLSAPYRVLPDGCLDIVLRVLPGGSGRFAEPEVLIGGPTSRPDLVTIVPGSFVCGVRFLPGQGGVMLRHPARDLYNQILEPDDTMRILGPLAGEVKGARTADELRMHLARLVTRLSARAEGGHEPPEVRAYIDVMTRTRGRARIGEFSRSIGASERTLRRQVTAAVGLSPKTLASVLRFQHTLSLIRSGTGLAEAAVAGGYCDQAHMTREFQALGGITPGESAPG
ncbi:helix-turn-helix domain-containing protein [Methylobacterium aquaticum]|uniref:helix-turn-helix domain-containing protein n=1 Tax=Methylobacterium aquaticum TaxID=270351 RepID=UPI00069F6A3C|nr:helix-turn-helix domain-containing protein [Methylobacterium aquaticum]